MTRFVVDANVAIKWFLPEIHSAAALRLLDPFLELHAPDLLFSEVGNALWKHVRRGEISMDDAVVVFQSLEAISLQVWESKPLVPAALDIACRTDRTVYDSLYLATAVAAECQIVTADHKLFNALAKRPLGLKILWVEEVP